MHTISDATLLAYIEESLPLEQMTNLEVMLRQNGDLQSRLRELIAKRESGVHSIGDIWRRHRISCPTREELGSYLLGAMTDDKRDFIKFTSKRLAADIASQIYPISRKANIKKRYPLDERNIFKAVSVD